MKYSLIILLMISVLHVVSSDANQLLDASIFQFLNIVLLKRITVENSTRKWNLSMDNPSPNYTYVIVSQHGRIVLNQTIA